ncbi:hypothetical protein HU200_009066 [Digitaria exilis]|uniref:EF-hand domain-containing protein n=1 Tax=Digitaria exilis TaxID=1010633 RepID=A0A835FKE3_9POAL|nr:hypothetical protein HU200_009066 [Digitaria exilis]
MVMGSLGQSRRRRSCRRVNGVDADGSGAIDFQDLHTLLARQMREASGADEDELREAFRIASQEQNGFISGDELRHVLHNHDEHPHRRRARLTRRRPRSRCRVREVSWRYLSAPFPA